MTVDERTGKVAEYIQLNGSLLAMRERDVPTGVYTVKYQHTDALGTPVVIGKAERGESVGANIKYDPDSHYGGKNSEGSTRRPAFVDLAHEFGHALALDQGKQSFDRGTMQYGTTPPSEKQSMELENAVRKEHDLPLRPSYYFAP